MAPTGPSEIASVLVTGSTGLVGSNACRIAASEGLRVRALARSLDGMDPLRDLGVEVVLGDASDPASLTKAADGVDGVVHTAAVLGGTWTRSKPDDFWRVNHVGSVNVLDAARVVGARTVLLSSYGAFEWHMTMTERARPWPIGSQASAYVQAKIATYYEGMARAATGTQDVMVIIPGCIIGPSLFPERALDQTSFDGALLRGLTGDLTSYIAMPMLWAAADDVASTSLAALRRGTSGRTYLALGRPDEVLTLASLCNLGAEVGGIPIHVDDIDPKSEPERYGTIGDHAQRVMADPRFDASVTNEELGLEPMAVREVLEVTIDWFRQLGKVRPRGATRE